MLTDWWPVVDGRQGEKAQHNNRITIVEGMTCLIHLLLKL